MLYVVKYLTTLTIITLRILLTLLNTKLQTQLNFTRKYYTSQVLHAELQLLIIKDNKILQSTTTKRYNY